VPGNTQMVGFMGTSHDRIAAVSFINSSNENPARSTLNLFRVRVVSRGAALVKSVSCGVMTFTPQPEGNMGAWGQSSKMLTLYDTWRHAATLPDIP
jgi:hypothetical protein